MKVLDPEELQAALSAMSGWRFEGGRIVCVWSFPHFVRAMEFVNRVAEMAEAAGHHPDIDIRYNRVTLGLVTHDANGVTERDVAMAHSLGDAFPPSGTPGHCA